jgi:prepilin-type N-terminal cleavage/methylation domain-containing protein
LIFNHNYNRHRRRFLGTSFNIKRGFSLIELAASLAIFLLAGGAVTLAIGNAGINGGQIRLERAIRTELTALTNQVSNGPYGDLVTGIYTRPSACAIDERSSCITVNGRSYTVVWGSTLGKDALGTSNATPMTVTLTATVTLASAKTIAVSATAVEPTGNWSAGNYASVRVGVVNPAAYKGPVYLYSAKTGVATVISASSPLGDNSTVSLRYLTTSCGLCRIALSPTGSNLVGDYMIDQAASANHGYIIDSSNGVSDVAIVIRKSSKISLSLWARNTDGSTKAPPASTAGSICLNLSYMEGANSYTIPGCNTSSNPSQITFSTFVAASEITNGSFTSAIPSGVPLTFSSDGVALGSACADPNAAGIPTVVPSYANGSGTFASGIECTSWTWGYPKWLNTSSNQSSSSGTIFEGGSYTIPAGSTTADLSATWDQSYSSPAAGASSGDSLWVKARTKRSSSIVALSSASLASFDSSCAAGVHCASSANFSPYPTTGRFVTPLGNQFAVTYNSGSGAFQLAFADNDFVAGSPITVTLTSTTTSSSLYNAATRVAGDLISSGSTLISSCTVLPCAYNFWYGSTGVDSFVVTLTQGGVSSNYTLGLAPTTGSVWGIAASSIVSNVNQGSSKYFILSTYNFAGALVGGVPFTTSASTIGYTTTNTTASSVQSATSTCPALLVGQACMLLSALSSTPAGTYTVANSATGGLFSSSVAATINQVPGLLSITSATSAAQGGSNTINVLVRDGNSTPIAKAPVYLTSVYTGATSWTPGVKPSVVSCSTDAQGTCSLALTFESSAPAGTYTFTVASGSLTAASSFTVTQVSSQIQVSSQSITQGSSITVPITILDGAGAAYAGITPSISAISGLTITGLTASNGSGLVTANFAASSSIALGRQDLTITAGSFSSTLRLNVLAVATGISATTASIVQGSSAQVSFYALDTNGANAGNISLSSYGGGGLLLPAYMQANKNGLVKMVIAAPLSLPVGSYSFTIKNSNNTVIGSIPVSVTAGVSSIVAQQSAKINQTTSITLLLRDSSGNVVPNKSLTIKSTSIYLTIPNSVAGSLTTTSDAYGVATLSLSVAGNAKSAIYNISILVDGATILVPVAVVP